MRILITGASGMLGSFLMRYLDQFQSFELAGQIRASSPEDLLLHNKFQYVVADLSNPVEVFEITQGYDVIIHAAALVSHSLKRHNELMHSNVELTANVVNAAIENGVKDFIFISSTAAFPKQTEEKGAIDEDTIWTDTPFNSAYGKSKHLAELEVWRGRAEGLNTSILNPSMIFGAGFWHKGTSDFFRKIHEGLTYYPAGKAAFVDIRDVGQAVKRLLDNPELADQYLILGGHRTYQDVFGEIAKAIATNPPSRKLTTSAIRLWGAKKLVQKMWNGKKASNLNLRSVLNAQENFQYDSGKSIDKLGMHYTDISGSIQALANLFKLDYLSGKKSSFYPV